MTVSDYLELIQSSASNFFDNFLPIFTNVVAAVIALIAGVVVGWILKWAVTEISRALSLERTLTGLPLYSSIVKSHEEVDVTTLLGETVRWIAIIVFIIPAVAALQIDGADAVFSSVFGYISSVIVASLYLLFGFVVAWFVHRVVAAVGTAVRTIPAHLLANVAYLAIVTYAAIQAALVLGVTVDTIRLVVIALFAAGALAFGLAAKDAAADMVKKFIDKSK